MQRISTCLTQSLVLRQGWLGSSHATSPDAAKTFSGWANSSFAEYLPYAPWVEQAEGALWVRSTLPS